MDAEDPSSLKLSSLAQDEAERQRSSSTVASAGGADRLATQESLLPFHSRQLQQQAEAAVAAAEAAVEAARTHWKPPAAEQHSQGNPRGRPTGTHAEAADCTDSAQLRHFPYDQNLALSVCLSSSSSSDSGLDSPSNSYTPKQHNPQQQLLQPHQQQEQPVSCIVTEGFSGEVAYLEFVPQGDHTGLQLLARARKRGNSSALLRVAASAFDAQTTAATDTSGQSAGAATTGAGKAHEPTVTVQQLKPLLHHSPVLADARDRGVGSGGTSPSSSNSSSSSSGPRCWVVGYEELIEGLLPAWRSLSDASRECLLSAKGDRSLRRRLKKALSTLQGFRVQLEDQQQLLARTRFLRRTSGSRSSGNSDPQETLQKIIHCYVGISRLAEETHAAAEGLLQHVRNGKQLQQQLQQQQHHFAAAIGRLDSFAHSLQQLQQLARQEEQHLQQMQQQQKQHIWKLMDQWSSGEVEMQQQLLKTVLQIAAADAKHMDELREAWIQLMCLSALPRKLAAEETADVPTATVAAAETGSSEIADTLREEGSLVKRIGFTKEQAPRLLLLCLMLEADELAGWVLHWIDACMPIATTPAEAGGSKDGKVPGCKDSATSSSWAPAAAVAAAFVSDVAAAQQSMQPEAAVYTPEIYAFLRRRLLRIRACSHLSSSNSKMTKARSRRSTAAPPSSIHQDSHRSISPSTGITSPLATQQHKHHVTAAASAPATYAAARGAYASGPREGRSGRTPTPVAASICPSPARRRSCTTDTRAAESASRLSNHQHQHHNGPPAAAVQSPPTASATYASGILNMIKPLLVSEEEVQLERQHMHHMYNTTDEALQKQLLLLQQEEQLLQLHRQQAQQRQQQQSVEQLMQSHMPQGVPFMLSSQEELSVQLENDTDRLLRQELALLQQKEQEMQQRRLQLLALSEAETAAAVGAETRRSSRRLTSPPRRQLSMRRRQQHAGVFAAAPPKSSSSSRSPSSPTASVKELLPPPKAAAAADLPALQQHQPTKQQQQHLQEQQLHQQEQQDHLQEQQLPLQEEEQQHESEQYTALDLTLQRIFRVPAASIPGRRQNGAAGPCKGYFEFLQLASRGGDRTAAKRQQQGMGVSGEERKALAEKLRRLAQQLQDDEEPTQEQQNSQEQQQPQQYNKRHQQQQQQECQKRTPPNMNEHADTAAAASLQARCRSSSSSAVNDECIASSNKQTERQRRGSKGAEAAAEECAATRSASPPTVEMEQQAKVLQVLDILMRQIETSQGLTSDNTSITARETETATATAAVATRRVSSSFFTDTLSEGHEELQQEEGRCRTQNNSTTQAVTAFAASGATAVSPPKAAARMAHPCSSTAALMKGVRQEGQPRSRASSAVFNAAEDSKGAVELEHQDSSMPTSSLAEARSCCSGQCTPRRNESSEASGQSAAAAAVAVPFKQDRSVGTARRRQHDPFSEAVLQLLHDEKQQQQQQQRAVRRNHPTSAHKVQQQQPQQKEVYAASLSPPSRSIAMKKQPSLQHQNVNLAKPDSSEQRLAAEDSAHNDVGPASKADEGGVATHSESTGTAEGKTAAALAAIAEAASAGLRTTMTSQGQPQQCQEQRPYSETTSSISMGDSSYASSKSVVAETAAAEAKATPAKAVAASTSEPVAAAAGPEAEATAETAEKKPEVALTESATGENKSNKQQQQLHGKAVSAGKTTSSTESKRHMQRGVSTSCNSSSNSSSNNNNVSSSNSSSSSNNSSSNSSSSNSRSANSRTAVAKRFGGQPDEAGTRNEQTVLQRRLPQQQYSRQQQQQKKATAKSAAAAAAAADKPGLSATSAPTHSTTAPQQQQRRERQLLLLQQQRQRLRREKQLQQQQQLSPLEELKLRRIKVKEIALQQRLKASGLAYVLEMINPNTHV
ncbi:LOW QUALITY PROTEIN: uncharacterized protein EMH_0022630 [Eimeria mitis]|uniref:Uncharacterized protein n=1 Tax=Eimeria mitis TaxID=44415 RepID=U6KDP0_9EIME|nr:LOW QUALITY PROTEIN: uncharacterized protein EMH_0022630 [Eimeria mitis]CDJ34886.1 hypothetical protein EMH_0022630 [Eimeria mitis]